MSEFPADNQVVSGLSSELSTTPDGAAVNGGRAGDVAAMIENFQHKKAAANSTSAMLNRINSNVVPVPGAPGVVVSSMAGSPGTVVVNTSPSQVMSSSSSSSSSRVKRSSQVHVSTSLNHFHERGKNK